MDASMRPPQFAAENIRTAEDADATTEASMRPPQFAAENIPSLD